MVYTIALEILPQVGVLIAICTNALRLFLESESPRSRRWYVSLATSCSHVLRTAIPGHIGRRGVHVRPHSEDIRCSTPRWYPPRGGGSMADPLRKNTDSSRQGSPPNDGVLVLRFRPIRRFWRIMSKSAFSTKSWKYHIRVHFWHSMLFRYSETPPVIDVFTKQSNGHDETQYLGFCDWSSIFINIFFMWMKKYFTDSSNRRERRWDECVKYFLSTQKIFSCHDDEHTSRTYMKTFYNTWCVHLVIVTPVMSRSQFLHPGGGGAKMAPKHTPATTVQGGVRKPPPKPTPPGGVAGI